MCDSSAKGSATSPPNLKSEPPDHSRSPSKVKKLPPRLATSGSHVHSHDHSHDHGCNWRAPGRFCFRPQSFPPTNTFVRTKNRPRIAPAMSSSLNNNNETTASTALTTAMERLKSALRTRVDESTATREEVASCSDELDELMMEIERASEETGVDAEGARVLARARQARQTYRDVLVRGP